MQECHFREAFSALSEAVKYKRESWQTWSNYAHAAVQTHNHLQAARGILQVTKLPCRALLHCCMLSISNVLRGPCKTHWLLHTRGPRDSLLRS